MKKKKPAPTPEVKPPEPYNKWHCTCGAKFDSTQLFTHLLEAHGVADSLGQSKLVMHIDGVKTYQDVYDWVIGGVKLVQSVLGVREVDARKAVNEILCP